MEWNENVSRKMHACMGIWKEKNRKNQHGTCQSTFTHTYTEAGEIK